MNKQLKVLTLIAAMGLSGAAALLPAVASAAPVLPDPVYAASLTALNTNQNFAAPGTYTLGGASTTVTAGPSLTGHTVGAPGGVGAESVIVYSFAVDGPLNDVLVPLFVTADLYAASASVTGQGSASARFSVYSAGRASSPDIINMYVSSSDTPPSNFSGTLPFSLRSGQVGGVTLQIDVSSFQGGVADAFADPFIFIDPDFLSINPGYSVIVSAGIGNTALAVIPVPAAVWLFGSGLLGLIGVARRKKA